MDDFKPLYPGDNPNRAWVRDAVERKGIKVDYRDVIMHASAAHIRWLFKQIIRVEFPGHYGNREPK